MLKQAMIIVLTGALVSTGASARGWWKSIRRAPDGMQAGDGGYNHFSHAANCARFGYPPNCAYQELPDWNGGFEVRNPR